MKPGTSFNPLAAAPDPWAVALAKGLIKNETEYLTWQANPPDAQVPGDPEVYGAWMARYGLTTLQVFPGGAELELTVWPRVLNLMWLHEWGGQNPGLDGNPTPREIKDAAAVNDKGMVCRAFVLDKAEGYVPEKPILISRLDLPPGLLEIPGRKRVGEPAWHAQFRVPWGCPQFYRNDAAVAPPGPPAEPPPPVVPPVEPPVEPPPVDDCPGKLAEALALLSTQKEVNAELSMANQRLAAEIERLKGLVKPPIVLPQDVKQTLDMMTSWREIPSKGGRINRLQRLKSWALALEEKP